MRMLIGLMIAALFMTAITAKADCTDASSLKVVGASASELASACESFARVTEFFASVGARTNSALTITFLDEVTLPNLENPLEPIRVFGYFDSDKLEIKVTKFNAKSEQGKIIWGAPWSDAMATSFLLHEIAHYAAITSMGANFKSLSQAWHEAIAYTLQFKLMDPRLRAQILNANRDLTAFDESAINDFIYGMDPHSFAIRSYLFIEKNEQSFGSAFWAKLLNPTSGQIRK